MTVCTCALHTLSVDLIGLLFEFGVHIESLITCVDSAKFRSRSGCSCMNTWISAYKPINQQVKAFSNRVAVFAQLLLKLLYVNMLS